MKTIPNKHLKRIVQRKIAMKNRNVRKRKLNFTKEDITPANNINYDINCQQPDLPNEEIERLVKLQIEMLDVTSEEQVSICKSTVAQPIVSNGMPNAFHDLQLLGLGKYAREKQNLGNW